MNWKAKYFTLIISVAAFAVSCGGGGAAPYPGADETDTGDQKAAIQGILTDSGITERSVSAIASPISEAEVWCEDALDGAILGLDVTDESGEFIIEDLPAERSLLLRFRYIAMGDAAMIEGETDLVLAARERRQITLQVQQQDVDGDGESDAVTGEMEQLRLRLREMLAEDGAGEEPPAQVMERFQQQGPVERPLPELPPDNGDDEDKDASDLEGEYTVSGLDYIDMHNGVELEDGLFLGGEDCRLSWALYRIDGLVGQDIASLTVSCAPEEEDEYFILVSNYSQRRWEWSEAINVDEYTFEVNPRFRHVNLGGKLYFVIVTFGADACTMYGAAATPRELPAAAPFAPIQLHASKGISELEGVELTWLTGNPDWEAEEQYSVLRALPPTCLDDSECEPPEFVEIGTTEETTYFDDTALEGVIYIYAVVAIVGEERSGRSNLDRGFWITELPDEQLNFIEGLVQTGDGEGIGGVSIALEYGEYVRRVISHQDGTFVIHGLPDGSYVLTPYRRGLTFEPDAALVELPTENEGPIVFVGYRTTDL